MLPVGTRSSSSCASWSFSYSLSSNDRQRGLPRSKLVYPRTPTTPIVHPGPIRLTRGVARWGPSGRGAPHARGVAHEPDECGVDRDPNGADRLPLSALVGRAGTREPRDRGIPGQPQHFRPAPGCLAGGQRVGPVGADPVLIPTCSRKGSLLGSLTLVTRPLWLSLWILAIGVAAGFVAGLPDGSRWRSGGSSPAGGRDRLVAYHDGSWPDPGPPGDGSAGRCRASLRTVSRRGGPRERARMAVPTTGVATAPSRSIG
jgi:hypothetical protein